MKEFDLMNTAINIGWNVSIGEKSWVFTSADDTFVIRKTNPLDMCANVVALAGRQKEETPAYQPVEEAFQKLMAENTWICTDEEKSQYCLRTGEAAWKFIEIRDLQPIAVCSGTVDLHAYTPDQLWKHCENTFAFRENFDNSLSLGERLDEIAKCVFDDMTLLDMEFGTVQGSYDDAVEFIRSWIRERNEVMAPANSEWNTMAYQKLFSEQEEYKNHLLTLPPAAILDAAYEYVTRENILLSFEDNDLSNDQCRKLLAMDYAMDKLYSAKVNQKGDNSEMEAIWNCVCAFIDNQEENNNG